MLLFLSSGFGWVDLVEHLMRFLLDFRVAAGKGFESAESSVRDSEGCPTCQGELRPVPQSKGCFPLIGGVSRTSRERVRCRKPSLLSFPSSDKIPGRFVRFKTPVGGLLMQYLAVDRLAVRGRM